MMMDNSFGNKDWSLDMVSVHIGWWWGLVHSDMSLVGLILEDLLADAEELILVHRSIVVGIGLLENNENFGIVVASGVANSSEEVIEEMVHFSDLHLARLIGVVNIEQFVNVLQYGGIVKSHFFLFLLLNIMKF